MMRTLCKIFIALLAYIPCYAQKDYTDFNSVNIHDSDIVYYDQFGKVDTNNFPWLAVCSGKDDVVKNIKDGMLQINTTFGLDSETHAGSTLEFDYSKDFEVEIRAAIGKKKVLKRYAGFVWGVDSNKDHFNGQFILFHNDGSHQMGYHNGLEGKSSDFERLKMSSAPNGSFVIYTIRKLGNEYYVFVNKKFKGSYTYTPLKGQMISIFQTGDTKLYVDYIRMSYISSQ